MQLKQLPRLPIAHLPTPIEELPRLSAALGGPRLLVKRDDQTGLAFGGNKTRKLEYLAAEAQAQNAKTLITAGAVQSNHCRQTAAAAARLGFDCILVLAGDPSEEPSANYLLDQILGVEVVWANWESRHDDLQRAFEGAVKDGRKPYLVPYGGSSPMGAAAYAYAVEEMLAQDVDPDWIVFASSSGGTQAGLVAGAHLFGYQGKVLGISIDEPKDILQKRVAAIASDVTELMGKPNTFLPESIRVNADYLGAGYGIPGQLEKESIQLFARHEGLLLDPVYTGRVAGGMIDLIRDGFYSPDETVLFWHTGGTPSLFADKYRRLFA